MKLIATMDTDHAAFKSELSSEPDAEAKQNRIWVCLGRMVDRIWNGAKFGKFTDGNGNVVGDWKITEDS